MNDLTARLQLIFNPVARTDRSLGSIPYSIPIEDSINFVFGTGLLQINQLFDDSQTLAPAAFVDYDLNAGGLVNYNGEAVSFAKVKGLYVKNYSLVDPITIAPSPAAGWAAFGTGIILPPNSFMPMGSWLNGWVVTAGADKLRLTNGPTGPTKFDLVLIGNN